MALRPCSLADPTTPDSLYLPYLSVHRSFPKRPLRLRAIEQFRDLKVMNASLRLSPQPQSGFREIKYSQLTSVRESEKSDTNQVFHNKVLRRRVRRIIRASEEIPTNLTHDATLTHEDRSFSPVLSAGLKDTPTFARRLLLPKHKFNW